MGDYTRSTNINDTRRTDHTDPRKRHHPDVPVLGDRATPTPEQAGWRAPVYRSRRFWRWLLFTGQTLRQFQLSPMWSRAVAAGLIVGDRWKGPQDWQDAVVLPPEGTNPTRHRLTMRNPEQEKGD